MTGLIMKSPRGTRRTTEDTEITEQIPGCSALSVSVISVSSVVYNSAYPGDCAADRICHRRLKTSHLWALIRSFKTSHPFRVVTVVNSILHDGFRDRLTTCFAWPNLVVDLFRSFTRRRINWLLNLMLLLGLASSFC